MDAAIQRDDIARLRQLIAGALAELPASLRSGVEDGGSSSASEYGHWSRRLPKDAMVNVGSQRATNPS